jgi:hypothetical protein
VRPLAPQHEQPKLRPRLVLHSRFSLLTQVQPRRLRLPETKAHIHTQLHRQRALVSTRVSTLILSAHSPPTHPTCRGDDAQPWAELRIYTPNAVRSRTGRAPQDLDPAVPVPPALSAAALAGCSNTALSLWVFFSSLHAFPINPVKRKRRVLRSRSPRYFFTLLYYVVQGLHFKAAVCIVFFSRTEVRE